ncbi:uncharacterized protein LOC116005840 [Ipomoea triloba]|uniref:uncharacterized protein LOC116005840 n=1 Tax=Ipomoea triloba TaxID=35885 RepID=UPI00125D7994|nr:uncharacterized protein LOC116005840 [Ipomoea triloba]
MENSKNALDSQRYSEESDQLERSTRKRKVTDDAAGTASTEPTETTPLEQLSPAEVEVVSETPLNDPTGTAMQIEGDGGINHEAVADHATESPPQASIMDALPRSYRDSVVGSGSGAAPFLLANLSDDEVEADPMGNEDLGLEDSDPLCPRIRFTAKEKDQIRAPWRQSLIIKVMGRRVGYAYLLHRLNTMWHPKGRMELIALENDYFLVRFGMVEDLEFAKFESHWMILDHYLIIKDWVPNFDPFEDAIEKVLVWVRFPNILVEYYNLLCLRRIDNKLGRTVRIDHTTSLVSRGKLARVCVEIDITKPLLPTFTLEDKVWKVAYEGIHLVCFSCGLYGHRLDSCPHTPVEQAGNETDMGQEVAD